MKKEDLFEALNDIDEQSIAAAGQYRRKRRTWQRWSAVAACAAVLIAAVVIWRAGSSSGSAEETVYEGVKTVSAKTPAAVAKDMSMREFMESEEHSKWFKDHLEKFRVSREVQGGMEECCRNLIRQLLPAEEENTVCSPLNIYLAFSMLAEVSDGNTRQQILDVLAVPDIETLRTRAMALWQSNYLDTPMIKCTLGNSMWLNDKYAFNEETLNRLAEVYCASSYRGDPAAEEMNRALREWTDRNTGGLLKEYADQLELDPETAIALVSTLYFQTSWAENFEESETQKEVFHGTKGDTQVDMMHRTELAASAFQTETFTALGLSLNEGTMVFYLPQEGADVNDLLSDPDLFAALHSSEDARWISRTVNMSIPRFRVSEKTDLKESMKELGITDVLDPAKADFSSLTKDTEIFLGGAEHAATVEIDENGVTAAAYTDLEMAGGAMIPNEILDFCLDRPFLFLITGRDGSILFAGAVRNID